jgi:hypothetical protein
MDFWEFAEQSKNSVEKNKTKEKVFCSCYNSPPLPKHIANYNLIYNFYENKIR